MRQNPGSWLVEWWRNASPRAHWMAGIALFSLLSTGALIILSGLPMESTSTGGVREISSWYYVEAFIKFLVVLGLILGAGVAYRAYLQKQPFRPGVRHLEVIETTRLSQRQAIHLIRAGGHVYLVGATDQAIALLSEVDLDTAQALTPTATPAPKDFQNVLQSLTRQ